MVWLYIFSFFTLLYGIFVCLVVMAALLSPSLEQNTVAFFPYLYFWDRSGCFFCPLTGYCGNGLVLFFFTCAWGILTMFRAEWQLFRGIGFSYDVCGDGS